MCVNVCVCVCVCVRVCALVSVCVLEREKVMDNGIGTDCINLRAALQQIKKTKHIASFSLSQLNQLLFIKATTSAHTLQHFAFLTTSKQSMDSTLTPPHNTTEYVTDLD